MNKQLRILADDIPDLFNRHFVGFDRVFDHFANVSTNSYPPHNIVKVDEDQYEIEFSLAGFSIDDINIEVKDGMLTISGEKTADERDYVYQGISTRAFVKQFNLTDHLEVDAAEFEDGILKIALHREVPEALKPKTIEIARITE